MSRTNWMILSRGEACREALAKLTVVAILIAWTPVAHAGFLVGTGNGNDNKANVLAVINDYNAVNDPDLPTEFELFKKTDDDAAFVFDPANGFMFFEDAAGTTPVLTEAALTELNEAYFSYTGPANLLYYSVKGGPDFHVYTFQPGLNLLESPLVPSSSPAGISHVSFWVPEPSAAALMLLGTAVVLAWGRRRGRSWPGGA